jgi:hypothetical protein
MRIGHVVALGLSLMLSAAILGGFLYRSRRTQDAVSVTGAASRSFTADIAKWRATISQSAAPGDFTTGFTKLSKTRDGLVGHLEGLGVADSSVTLQPVSSYSRYDNQGREVGLEISQTITVVGRDVELLEGLAYNPMTLIEKGIAPQSSSIEYFYSGINELKHSLLAGASEDARKRATEIVSGTGRGIGGLTQARAGVFQITEPFSTEVSDYGMHSTATRAKVITVTVHATFALE